MLYISWRCVGKNYSLNKIKVDLRPKINLFSALLIGFRTHMSYTEMEKLLTEINSTENNEGSKQQKWKNLKLYGRKASGTTK